MKKLGRSVTVIVFSVFILSLLFLSHYLNYIRSQTLNSVGNTNIPSNISVNSTNPSSAANTVNTVGVNGVPNTNTINNTNNPSSPNAAALLSSDPSLSKNYLDDLLAAELALSRGDLKVALANYSWVAKKTQDPKISKRATEIALLYGVLEKAQELALLWAKTDPNNLEAKLTSAAILIRAENLKEALSFFKQIEALQPKDAQDQFLLLYKQLEDPNDRARITQLLEQLHTKSAYIALSEIYLFQSDNNKALANSEKALQLDPNNTAAIILYTQSLVSTNQVEKAKSFLDAQLQKQANNAQLKFFYVQFYEEQGLLNKAHKELVSLSKLNNLTPAELFLLARLSMEGKWLPEAEVLLKKLEALPEQSDLANYFLGRLSESQSNPPKAIEAYLRVENPPFYAIAHVRASLLYAEMGKTNEALQVLDNMETNQEEERAVILTKIEILAATKEYAKAIALIDALLQNTPDDAELKNARALLTKKMAEKTPQAPVQKPAPIKQRQ